MKTGLDKSIPVCRAEGYAVVEHYSLLFRPDKQYLLTITNPKGWTDEGGRKFSFKGNHYHIYQMITYRELHKMWLDAKGINEFCGCSVCPFTHPDNDPCFHDFAQMAQTLFMFKGEF